MLTGSYLPGTSVVHHAPVWLKFVILAAYTSVLLLVREPVVYLALSVLAVTGYAVAGFGPRVLAGQVWPLRWIVVLLTPLQVWSAGWYQAGLTIGSLVLAVAVASLLTVTTRINDMLDSMVAGLQVLRPLGVDPDRVALLLALAIRSIPVIATVLQQSQEARAARGLDRSLRALLTPTMNRTIRYAQGVGEALMARGLDD
ncbi:MAG: energy-coupling factor transporter transmembrane protein EcfT [Austwickia sp.]|nr:energy-coupling factor transporter transmembrane protein EcfT [Austwickia sp.]MBK8436088.1 energy-coupling factor transporter transmembrane protein EcfT [Austwickia sp.]MBK9101768.1 energy-coupling factor transporter transmembrane protein EcfT [Austwickia sp.]